MQSDSNNQNPWQDPDRTAVLPQTVLPQTVLPQPPGGPGTDGFPITEDLPAVRIRQGSNWGRNLGLLVLVVGLAVALAFAANLLRDRRSGTAAEFPAAPAPTAVATAGAAAAPVVTTSSDPGFWQVVGVADGLNVRSGPGTQNDIVGTLAAEQRHVFATGELSSNGGDWMQIALDDTDQVGWVSARFLAPDTAPEQGQPRATVAPTTSSNTANTSTVCFASVGPTRVARVEFTNRVEISGVIRTGSQDAGLRQQISGTLDAGQALVTLTNSTNETVSQQQWTFNPANVALGDGTAMEVVDCATVSLS